MNPRQKFILLGGLVVAIATTLLHAPYRWEGHWLRLGSPAHGIMYRPLASAPDQYDVMNATEWTAPNRPPNLVGAYTIKGDEVIGAVPELDLGMLALWLGGIAALTIIAILLAS